MHQKSAVTSPKRLRLGIYDLGGGGGSTRYLNDLLAGIPRDRYELVFFPEGTLTEKQDNVSSNAGVTFQPAPTVPPPPSRLARFWRLCPQSLRLLVGMIRDTWKLRQQFRRRPVDILHTNCAGFEESPIAARLAGIKLIVGTYNVLPSPEYITAPWLQRLGEWLGARSLDAAVAGAHQIAVEWTQRCPVLAGRFVDIPWGIDVNKVRRNAANPCTRAELGVPADAPLLAMSARLHPMKGVPYLLEAMVEVRRQHPLAFLLIIGDGPARVELEQTSTKLGLNDRVRFLGWRSDSLRVVALCDMMVLASVYLETWGSALAEAMALGKPVVATRIGGVPELVADEQTGLIVPPRDPSALADAINKLLSAPALAQQLGEAGRHRVETVFTIESMQQETVQLYDLLLRGAKPPVAFRPLP